MQLGVNATPAFPAHKAVLSRTEALPSRVVTPTEQRELVPHTNTDRMVIALLSIMSRKH